MSNDNLETLKKAAKIIEAQQGFEMELLDEIIDLRAKIPKTYEQHRAHFIDRLKLRYEIDISADEYDDLLKNQHRKGFRGHIKKSGGKTFGEMQIKGIRVVLLYNNETKSFDTCYPPTTTENIDELIRATVISPMRSLAKEMYLLIMDRVDFEYRADFETIADAAKYYWHNCTFPNILIAKYNFGEVNLIKVMRMMLRLMYNDHRTLMIKVDVVKRSVATQADSSTNAD